ncbi:hypothetical protein FKW77_002889 [Venturia effusa]|uniref:DNA repair protein rad16 n=1 Tax=Venturia effusa TaxID=50376 RepID=A0A517L2V7_9PEZI|nr:hypothetical protein FKW77_002889 [Venturia effusa]
MAPKSRRVTRICKTPIFAMRAAFPGLSTNGLPVLSGADTPNSASDSNATTRRRIERPLSFVANSSDIELDISPFSPPSVVETRSQNRRLLHSVVIPAPAMTLDTGSRRETAASASSRTSTGSSTRDTSIGYDSPATTTANTPAAEGSTNRKDFKLGGSALKSSNKRKRGPQVARARLNDISRDEELARAMQEEEYGSHGASEAGPSFTRSGGRKRNWVDLGDDSDDEKAGRSISDSDDQPLLKRSQSVKDLKSLTVKSKPVRQASSSARKSIAKIESDSDEEISILSDDSFEDSDDDGPLADRRHSIDSTSSLSSLATASSMSTTLSSSKNKSHLLRAGQRRQQQLLRAARQARQAAGVPYDRKKARRNKLEKAHPEITTMWDELKKVPIITPVLAEQPESINRTLKSFQLEGLNWMMRQEQSSYKGGLLGDEMGMGKTIQAVSLIMSDYPAKDPTLVLVPPVALMQWDKEIGEYTNGALKVLVVHNSNAKSKNLTVKTIRQYDVIMMSYNSLESMYRKQEKGWSRGEDIVKEKSPIHTVKFHRLILDEAHSIKQRTTGIAKACFALKGEYKWCLSGTPVQNKIGEFFSLLRFLEVRPFADYFCERCECAQLHWSIGDDYMCKDCKHSAAEHRSVFNEELLNPITGDSMQLRSEAMNKLHEITSRVMLRRMKKDHTSSMELPPKEIVIHNEFFGEIERDFSSSIMSNTSRKFDTYVSQGVMLNNYANIFGLIMQMRQVANHPDLILKKHSEGGQNVLICNICDEPAEEAIRSRCHHEFCRSCVKSYVQTCEASGGDSDCPRCHIPLSIDWEQPDIEQDEDQVKKSSIINRIKMENWTSSTKIEMLVYDLYKLRSKKQTLKSIVFSQFTSMLQLIEWRLRRAGFNTVMLDGSMTPVQRQRSIDYFMNNTDVEVFLVSLKAGGVALNLTEASRVFIVDPWWNPAAEWQSADRCHRIGQTRPCVITRLCIEDSVESRMVLLQEKKANMISGTINNDKVAMDKLTPEDLQFLFRGT